TPHAASSWLLPALRHRLPTPSTSSLPAHAISRDAHPFALASEVELDVSLDGSLAGAAASGPASLEGVEGLPASSLHAVPPKTRRESESKRRQAVNRVEVTVIGKSWVWP